MRKKYSMLKLIKKKGVAILISDKVETSEKEMSPVIKWSIT